MFNNAKNEYRTNIQIKFYYKVPSSQASGAIHCDEGGGAICAYVRCDDFVNVDFGCV